MIMPQMKAYEYMTYGTPDPYGQKALGSNVEGTVKLSLNLSSQSVQDNVNYKDAQYVALTFDENVNDTYVINVDNKKLKVLYVNPYGRYKQVFLSQI